MTKHLVHLFHLVRSPNACRVSSTWPEPWPRGFSRRLNLDFSHTSPISRLLAWKVAGIRLAIYQVSQGMRPCCMRVADRSIQNISRSHLKLVVRCMLVHTPRLRPCHYRHGSALHKCRSCQTSDTAENPCCFSTCWLSNTPLLLSLCRMLLLCSAPDVPPA